VEKDHCCLMRTRKKTAPTSGIIHTAIDTGEKSFYTSVIVLDLGEKSEE